MNIQSLTLPVSSSIGTVSAQYVVPEKARYVMTLAHGAGAGMNHAFLVSLAELLAEAGIATLRFNFPFVEHKKGRPDVPAVAHKTIEAAIQHAAGSFPSLPLFVSGKSFGGRMSSQHLAAHPDPAVKGIVFYGFPLHPPGKPTIDRAEHLLNVRVPMLFLGGSRDALATWDLIESMCATLPRALLVKVEGADHSFKAGKQNMLPVLANATREWMEKIQTETGGDEVQ